MKAPDKIYINADAARDLRYYPGEDDGKELYIRKDALLEWVKEEMAEIAGEDEMYRTGRQFSLKILIDKLNSL